MCFLFLFMWLTFTSGRKKSLQTLAKVRGNVSLVKSGHCRSVKRSKEGLLVGYLTRCDSDSCSVMHFWFWPVLWECKNGMRQQHELQSWISLWVHLVQSGGHKLDSGADVVLFGKVRRSLSAGSSVFGGGLLNQVMWAGACVHLDRTN